MEMSFNPSAQTETQWLSWEEGSSIIWRPACRPGDASGAQDRDVLLRIAALNGLQDRTSVRGHPPNTHTHILSVNQISTQEAKAHYQLRHRQGSLASLTPLLVPLKRAQPAQWLHVLPGIPLTDWKHLIAAAVGWSRSQTVSPRPRLPTTPRWGLRTRLAWMWRWSGWSSWRRAWRCCCPTWSRWGATAATGPPSWCGQRPTWGSSRRSWRRVTQISPGRCRTWWIRWTNSSAPRAPSKPKRSKRRNWAANSERGRRLTDQGGRVEASAVWVKRWMRWLFHTCFFFSETPPRWETWEGKCVTFILDHHVLCLCTCLWPQII